MTSSDAEHGGGSGGGQAKDPARKAFEIARFVTGMQESLASVDRCSIPVVFYSRQAQEWFAARHYSYVGGTFPAGTWHMGPKWVKSFFTGRQC